MNKNKLVFGTILVLLIAISSILSTQLSKSMQTPNFNCPFFIIWFNTLWISIFIIPPSFKGSEIINIWQKDNLTPKRLLLKSFLFCCLWITANFCYVAALSRANSSAVVAIFSSNYAFVYLLSIYFLKESFRALSLLSLILSIVGILLLSLSSSALPSLLPLLLTLVSSFAAALYKVLLKLLLPSSSLLTTSSFLGFIGILNGLIFWPIWIAFEDLNEIPWTFLLSGGAAGLLYNGLINFGIIYTYPMFIAIGVGLAMPGNMLWDVLFNNINMESIQIIGSVLIITGFFCILLENYRIVIREAERKRKMKLLEEERTTVNDQEQVVLTRHWKDDE